MSPLSRKTEATSFGFTFSLVPYPTCLQSWTARLTENHLYPFQQIDMVRLATPTVFVATALLAAASMAQPLEARGIVR
jgi:hypothetical protein